MQERSLEGSLPYRELHMLIVLTNGLMCDDDFDMEEHNSIVEACGMTPQGEDCIKAMSLTCMGHRIPPELKERIDTK